jgi:hypothetical protein
MANLIAHDIKIKDLRLRRLPFKKVRINQIFYSDRRWYQKISQQIAITADSVENERRRIKATVMVRVMDEAVSSARAKGGMSFEEFIQNAAL